ncbi:MAG: hypothetical protein Q4G04_00600 [bacterium]|nr:hypothetical protein [bacterium]
MYITETTDNVRKLFDNLENMDNASKMRFLMYIFSLLNNNQINNKNIANPDLVEDDDLIIFNFESIGFAPNLCTVFLQYNILIYKVLTKSDELYEENGNVMGLKFESEEEKVISSFERLDFNEKLDVFSEIFIRYDNNTLYGDEITMFPFKLEESGFTTAKLIQDLKQK